MWAYRRTGAGRRATLWKLEGSAYIPAKHKGYTLNFRTRTGIINEEYICQGHMVITGKECLRMFHTLQKANGNEKEISGMKKKEEKVQERRKDSPVPIPSRPLSCPLPLSCTFPYPLPHHLSSVPSPVQSPSTVTSPPLSSPNPLSGPLPCPLPLSVFLENRGVQNPCLENRK